MEITFKVPFWRFMFSGCRTLRLWSIYPITYKGKKYVVEFEKTLTVLNCCVYEYHEAKKLFRGHRGVRLWEGEVTKLHDGDQELALHEMTKVVFQIHLPRIMKAIFEKYEEQEEAAQNMKLRAKEAEEWDGVVTVD